MANRLQPLNLMDFTGGLNLRRNQFQLAQNESPDLLNVDVDPRGGFTTRHGWQRWNELDVVDVSTEAWQPRNVVVHYHSTGLQYVYVANDDSIYWAAEDGAFTVLTGVTAQAEPHLVDFVPWGDDLYLATGVAGSASYRRTGLAAATALSPSTWSEVDAPVADTMPIAEFATAHAGYLFTAVTKEATVVHQARIRWSHPARPDSWREDDYIDIDAGGGRITGIMSFQDHLLIFKTNSLWALYGYDEDSWQLIKVSTSIGCPTITATSRSETVAYFFSAADRGGVYAYNGGEPVYISERMRVAFEEITAYENVFVSWAGRRLWIGVPWIKDTGGTATPTSLLVLDPDVGEGGAWTMYRSEYGAVAPVIDGSDVNAKYPLAAFWATQAAILVTLDFIDDAYDNLLLPPSLGVTPPSTGDDVGYLVTTQTDSQIGVEGLDFGQPFNAYYRTPWLHAGWPDRKKSWRRPTLICRRVPRQTELLVESFRDYDESHVHRSRALVVDSQGGPLWSGEGHDDESGDGFDWTVLGEGDPTGDNWSAGSTGSVLLRGGAIGLARAVQLKVSAGAGFANRKWGVDGIVAKIVMRRYR